MKNMVIGSKSFDLNTTHIMAILNVTPDSFSDGGKITCIDNALFHVEKMIEGGAEIIDIGGESSRPGHVKVSARQEMDRVLPYITAIKRRFDIPISLDTCKSEVAREGIKCGADMINDIWGLKYDSNMSKVIADFKVACCLMHNRDNCVYCDFMNDVKQDLTLSLDIAHAAGIASNKIILDVGVGFAKSQLQNLIVMNNIDILHSLGYPLLLGASRKSVIGEVLGAGVQDREDATIALSVIAAMKGVQFVRVHNVSGNYKAVKMALAVREERI